MEKIRYSSHNEYLERRLIDRIYNRSLQLYNNGSGSLEDKQNALNLLKDVINDRNTSKYARFNQDIRILFNTILYSDYEDLSGVCPI